MDFPLLLPQSFKTQSYFDDLIESLSLHGIEAFPQVQISTHDAMYHVPVGHARETSIAFYMPGHAMVVRLMYHESVHHTARNGEYFGYWRAQIHTNMSDFDVPNRQTPDFFYEEHSMYVRPVFEGFTYCGWSSRSGSEHIWNCEEYKGLSVQDIADVVAQFMNNCKPFVKEAFDKTTYLLWAPTYTFSGPQTYRDISRADKDKSEKKCRDLYWSRFGKCPELIKLFPKVHKFD